MKVAVIGGGSTYTPELVNGFLVRVGSFPLTELWLMDIDQKRLEIVGSFAQRMAAAHRAPFRVVLTADQRAAIRGAAYVITQLRVGQMAARREDEYLGRRHGLIGQETTGVGGMAKALRTMPVILRVAADMRELAPGALLANFTNPTGLVVEALTRYTPDVPVVGVCNVAITDKIGLLELLEKSLGIHVDPLRAELRTLGLNHLSWHRGLVVDGEDIWPRLFESYLTHLRVDPEAQWDVQTVAALGMVPNYYLHYYYYTDQELAEQQKWPPSRAEEVIEIERDLLRQYSDPALTEPPADLMKRGGAYYSIAATELLNAHYNDLGETHIVNVRHNGAVPGWPADWVLELPCRVDRAGIHPLPAEPLPPVCFGLLAQVKSYELLTVEAAVHGDHRAAYQALLSHPLGPAADKVQEVLDDLLETNRAHLPQFWGQQTCIEAEEERGAATVYRSEMENGERYVRYFLGADVGATKTHVLVADEAGQVRGFGEGGPGNHETVGYSGLIAALRLATERALASAGLGMAQIAAAGFGVAGLDWPSEEEPTRQAIQMLGLKAPFCQVNDATLGLLAGSPEGWGVAVVSGTSCNCRGWDRSRKREGRVTGHGERMGEAAGASELVSRALRAISHEWTQRGPATRLTMAFLQHSGTQSIAEMLEMLLTGQIDLTPLAAPLVFEVAAAGDPVAIEVVHWAGCELGEMANAVIRQLEFEDLVFDVVLVGSMFDGGPLLVEPMRQTVQALAPGARFVRLTVPPVVGAVLLAMEQVGAASPERREALIRSAKGTAYGIPVDRQRR